MELLLLDIFRQHKQQALIQPLALENNQNNISHMRVLLLSQYFAPEPADKWQDLAQGLKERGHNVEVLTSFPCYPQGKIYDGYRQSLFHTEMIDGNKVIRVPQIPDHSSSVFKRILYYCSFALSAATIGLFRTSKPDVILVYQSALPIGFAAWFISRLKRVPYVLDVVDLWPESVCASGMLNNRFANWVIRLGAKFVYRGAQEINVITEGYRENLIQMGIPAEKINLIYCWPAQGRFDPTEPDEAYAQASGLQGKFTVFYAGAIGPCQDLKTLLATAQLLVDLPTVQFLFAGDGVERAALIQQTKQLGLNNVHFIGYKSSDEVKKIYALSDLLLVHLKPNPMSKISIPSKTFAYMASGRPILMAVEGESAELVKKHNCGIAVPPSDPQQIADAIRSFMQHPLSVRNKMGEAARQAYQEAYSSEVQINKVAQTLLHSASQAA